MPYYYGKAPELLARFGIAPYQTPGHTPGAMSWSWQSCDSAGICKTIVYADSMSPVSSDDYRFSDHPEYVAQYRAGIERLRGLKCDILLTPHPSHSKMIERAATGTFEDGMTCADYANAKTSALDERLAKEAAQ
jgi:metallo-beta-lactamase class B